MASMGLFEAFISSHLLSLYHQETFWLRQENPFSKLPLELACFWDASRCAPEA
ncbi:BnaC03g76470D, partial [Brassica napus]